MLSCLPTYTNSKGGKHDDTQSYSVPQIVIMILSEFNVTLVILFILQNDLGCKRACDEWKILLPRVYEDSTRLAPMGLLSGPRA